MGAPITTHLPHTTLCAAHMSLLATLPLYYTHGIDAGAWRAIASLQKVVDETYAGSLGALLGAWIGAIPVPLDWYAILSHTGDGPCGLTPFSGIANGRNGQ